MKEILLHKVSLFFIFTLIILILLLTFYISKLVEDSEKKNLILTTKMLSHSISTDSLRQLSAHPRDINTSAYKNLHNQLIKIRQSNPSCKFLYIISKKENGQYFFYTDSQAFSSKDYLEPGFIYSEISQEYKDAMYLNKVSVVGPVTDRWGTFITVLAPIVDSNTNQTIATLGMDVTLVEWNKNIIIQTIFFLSIILMILLLIFILFIMHKKNKQLIHIKNDLLQSNIDLEKLSTIDELTQIYNRRKINEIIESEISRIKRNTQSFSLMIIDIDFFKHVNDNYGHHIGDIVLQDFAIILKNKIRMNDYLARWGGEEFIIISTDVNHKGIHIFVKKILLDIENNNFAQKGIKITASIGISVSSKDISSRELFRQADKALYNVKNSGRNNYDIFEIKEDGADTRI